MQATNCFSFVFDTSIVRVWIDTCYALNYVLERFRPVGVKQLLQWLGYELHDLMLYFQQGQDIFSFLQQSSPAVEPTQPHIQLVPGIRWPGCEADYLTSANGKDKNDCSYTTTLLCTFMIYTETVYLYILQSHFKTQGNIYLTLRT
jgi:hypothetical protein